MLEGIFVEKVFTQVNTRVYPIEPQATSGVTLDSQAIFKYSLKESDYPTITIVDPIYDNAGDIIRPGHYELALSDERNFLLLLESKEVRAVIPVIKIEEDETELRRINNKTVKKQLKKEQKAREKTNEKRKRVGMTEDTPYIHMEASLEYNKEKQYYLIKYQRDTIKAWGAFKG